MRDPVSILLVDDEPLARANLRLALRSAKDWRVVGEAGSVAEARTLFASTSVDVVFLDVQMPVQSGLTLARELAALEAPPVVVFVTAYEEFAVAAFELHAIDYLLKPVDDARLAHTVERVNSMLRVQNRSAYGSALQDYVADVSVGPGELRRAFIERLMVRSVGYAESVPIDQVRWIRAAGNYVELHLSGRTVLHRVTLERLEKRLDPSAFLRVHRSAIVRRDECAGLATTGDSRRELRLRNGARVAVSSRYLRAVREAMGE